MYWPALLRWGSSFETGFTYDGLGRVATVDYPLCVASPDGRRLCDDGNDLAAPPHTVSTSYRDALPWRVDSSHGTWASYAYHPNLQRSRTDYSNGVYGEFYQGTLGMQRPRRIRYRQTGGATHFDSGTYGYDGAGNIWSIGGDRYYYDQANRLVSASFTRGGQSHQEAYAYDAADNMTSYQRDGAPLISLNPSPRTNRMLGNDDIVYDGAGNVVAVGPGPTFSMTYDAFDMQAELDLHGGVNNQYLYAYGPGDLRLISLDWNGGFYTYHFRDLEGRVLRQYRVTGVPGTNEESWEHVKDFVYGADGLVATRTRTGVEYYFHQDHLGTPRAITDAGGVRRGRHDYYPFGYEVPRGGQVDEPVVKFTGHERDPHGLSDYMLGRTYFYPWMRFGSVDKARDGWNLYTYARNNPIKFTDPTGEAVYLKTHEVAVGNFHASVVVVPEDQEQYKNDDRFITTDEGGVYVTFGAGPRKGNLVSGTNRSKDADLDTSDELLQIDTENRDESEVIESLFSDEEQFPDTLDYDLFPNRAENQKWWLPDDGYNSNSFARGLLESQGLQVPQPSTRVPGFDKPVPNRFFQ